MARDNDEDDDDRPTLTPQTFLGMEIKTAVSVVVALVCLGWGANEKWNASKQSVVDAARAQATASTELARSQQEAAKEWARLQGTVDGMSARQDAQRDQIQQMTYKLDNLVRQREEEERWRDSMEKRFGEVRDWWVRNKNDQERFVSTPLKSARAPQ